MLIIWLFYSWHYVSIKFLKSNVYFHHDLRKYYLHVPGPPNQKLGRQHLSHSFCNYHNHSLRPFHFNSQVSPELVSPSLFLLPLCYFRSDYSLHGRLLWSSFCSFLPNLTQYIPIRHRCLKRPLSFLSVAIQNLQVEPHFIKFATLTPIAECWVHSRK